MKLKVAYFDHQKKSIYYQLILNHFIYYHQLLPKIFKKMFTFFNVNIKAY